MRNNKTTRLWYYIRKQERMKTKNSIRRRSGIAQRILLGFATLIIAGVVTAGYVGYALHRIEQANSERDRIVTAASTADSLDIDVLRIIVLLQNYVDTKDPQIISQLQQNRNATDQLRAELRGVTRLPRVIELLDKYEEILGERRQTANRLITAVQTNAPESELRLLRQQRIALDDEARSYLREIVAIEKQASQKSLQETAVLINSTQQQLTLTLVPLFVLTLLISWLIIRSIVRPVAQLTNMAERLAKGDLTFRNTIKSNDEVGFLAATLNTAAEELKRLDTIKGEFISIVSHQLRTPATVVKQYLGLILEGYVGSVSPKQLQLIKEAYASNEEQIDIVDNILQVARIESGKIQLQAKHIDVVPLLKNVVSTFAASAEEKQQTLDISGTVDKCYVYADAAKLTMAIENLVSNAIKYTPNHGKVTLSARETTSKVILMVQDTGRGIAPEEIPQLFQKFMRLSDAEQSGIKGTGLGLYFAKKIIDMHNGTIFVKSQRNNGSQFIIELPKKDKL